MEFDFEAWPRRGIYEFFSGLSQPFYSVTFTLDVTKLYACVKRRGLSFYCALPWLELTSLTNERDFDRDDSVPRISWGRYTRTDGRMTLGMSVEVNHRLIDGVHIGRFAQTLEGLIDALD